MFYWYSIFDLLIIYISKELRATPYTHKTGSIPYDSYEWFTRDYVSTGFRRDVFLRGPYCRTSCTARRNERERFFYILKKGKPFVHRVHELQFLLVNPRRHYVIYREISPINIVPPTFSFRTSIRLYKCIEHAQAYYLYVHVHIYIYKY